MFNLALGRMGRVGNITGIQRAIAFLRSLGTSAHVWLPGANGVSVASLPSNNYLLSDGSTGYSTVDGVDGLTLDGMGSLGSAIYSTVAAAGVVALNGNGTVSTVGEVITATCTVAGTYGITFANVTGTLAKSYQLVFDVVTQSVVDRKYIDFGGMSGWFSDDVAGTNGVTRFAINVPTPATPLRLYKLSGGVGNTFSVRVVSVKEYTGTHLTQATTANKPLVRRGMLNELLNSATPATQSVTCIAAPYTLALYGTGNVVLSGTGAGTLTGTGASDLVVLNFTPTAGSVTFTKAGTVSSFGLFKGTWTAAQILAEGGIPTTTATAASNPTSGKYWWSFDGSNDALALGSVPFEMTDDSAVIVGCRNQGASAVDYMVAIKGANYTNVGSLYFAYGRPGAVWFDNSSGIVDILHASTLYTPAVITSVKRTNAKQLRVNSVQSGATNNTVMGTTTVTNAWIGGGSGVGAGVLDTPYSFDGSISIVIVVKGTLTDAELLLLERFAASVTPNGPVF